MKRIVWTFGLIAGGIMSVMMAITVPFMDKLGHSYIIGYTTMVVAFLMVFVGIRSYRDNVGGGSIGFGRAVQVGLLITAIASVCYVATWQVVYYKFMPDFMDKYTNTEVEKLKTSGKPQAEIDAQVKKMEEFKEMYKNPLVNIAFTFLEPLPVGLILVLVSAAVLRKKREEAGTPLTA